MSENINDKIVSHLICKYYLVDIIDKKLINSNVATRKNMGSSYGIKLIKKYINSVKLKHNKFYKTRVYDSKKGFCFLGYKFFLNDSNKLIIKVKYKNKVRIRRKLKYFKKYDIDKYKVVVNNYKGYFVMRNRQKYRKHKFCPVY